MGGDDGDFGFSSFGFFVVVYGGFFFFYFFIVESSEGVSNFFDLIIWKFFS